MANFTLKIIKDRFFEGIEFFTIKLTAEYSAKQLNVEICNPSTAIGHIIDKSKTDDVCACNYL